MKRPREFRPASPSALESRVVLSNFFNTINHDYGVIKDQVVSVAKHAVVKPNASRPPGAQDIAAHLGTTGKIGLPAPAGTISGTAADHPAYGPAAGLYVPGRSISRTTFDDGSSSTIVSVASHDGNMTTTLQTITQRDNTVKTGSLVTVVAGKSTSYTETVGQIGNQAETITGTDQRSGHTVTFTRSIRTPGSAAPTTIAGTSIKTGSTTTTDETITLPGGSTEHLIQATIHRPGRTFAVNTTLILPDGTTTTQTSTRAERGPVAQLPAGIDLS